MSRNSGVKLTSDSWLYRNIIFHDVLFWEMNKIYSNWKSTSFSGTCSRQGKLNVRLEECIGNFIRVDSMCSIFVNCVAIMSYGNAGGCHIMPKTNKAIVRLFHHFFFFNFPSLERRDTRILSDSQYFSGTHFIIYFFCVALWVRGVLLFSQNRGMCVSWKAKVPEMTQMETEHKPIKIQIYTEHGRSSTFYLI